MIDWFVLLTPLLLLPIVLLFVFVGCLVDREGTAGPGLSVIMRIPSDTIDAAVPSVEREAYEVKAYLRDPDTRRIIDSQYLPGFPATTLASGDYEYSFNLDIDAIRRSAMGGTVIVGSGANSRYWENFISSIDLACEVTIPAEEVESSWAPPEIIFSELEQIPGLSPPVFRLTSVAGCD